MNIKSIKRTLYEFLYFRKLIKKYGNRLVIGRYYMFPSMRAVVLNDDYFIKNATAYFKRNIKESKTSQIIEKINRTNFFINKNKKSTEQYEAIYSANNYDKTREIKLFSFKKSQILTVCTCAEICEKQLQEFQDLHDFFSMPAVIKDTNYKNSYNISMVKLKPYSYIWALEKIVSCNIKFNKKNIIENEKKKVADIISFNFNEEKNKILSKLVDMISLEILDLEIEMCLQHGDLSRDNLIYGECNETLDFWWIDWEHKGKRIFFYDYFFYMLNTAVYYFDTEALELYFNGQCDDHLKELFKEFNLTYNSRCRKDYFIIFLLDFLKERVCNLDGVQALKKYYDFIKNTEILNTK